MSQDNNGIKIKTLPAKNRFLAITMAGVLAAAFSAVWLAGTTASAQEETGPSTVVRDSVLLVGPRTIAEGDFVHLYDATPDHIMVGHVALKIPCDDDSNPSLQVLIGQAPNLAPANNVTLISELSTPGQQCMYHVHIESHVDPDNPLITDVAVQNMGDEDVELTGTSTVFVGINEIMPNPAGGENAAGNMTEGGSMQGMTP
ncbi:hypothetical protein [Nitrososphaera viennensis]|uniref:Uncharacterized protein n=2 Tax=Nitrososphaera viennensis TaxID=1034015 RepID=A0A060HG96_9ARCH|nr:hypothetical protein [Nitrososphaera viennensis]AIC15654.1 exported protein of unknown function [Nitrososphaera viennensis EN76]UVS70528.1 hypothetical protein NWT39_07020 [Nitrososphaera viennensis]